ncbi:MAG: dihydrofolate reductase family protein [Friedmanniella sp.]
MSSPAQAGQPGMGSLHYAGITSLDGYVADRDGSFDWSVPDEEVHQFVNDLQRRIGTHLYGRRLYQVMLAWETLPTEDASAVMADFAAIWRAADKVVYSSTLQAPSSARTRIERRFDPATVGELKASTTRDLLVGGPELAAQALRAGLVDEIEQLVSPVVVGGGTRFLPEDLTLQLELIGERRFGNGVVHLAYRVLAVDGTAQAAVRR